MIDNKFIVVVPVYNAEKYIGKCLESVLGQNYKNYDLIVIDDCSTDNTYKNINVIHDNCENIFTVCKNHYRIGSALANIVIGIELFSHDKEDIIVTVDGDDFLYNNNVLSYLDGVYQDKNIYMTYGQFVPLSGDYGKFCKPILDTTTYRQSKNWYASHLRTFKNKLWYKIDNKDLRDENGEYFKVATDPSYLYPMLEMCGTKHYKFIDDILYVYNDLNIDNVMKINKEEQLKNVINIRSKPVYKEIEGDL
jgi:glycosyltransferase involved in cell wall biosynthesis